VIGCDGHQMHELPITQNILDIVLHHARQAGASRVVRVNITIGKLASIVDDSVQFYWEIIAKDTIAEKASLNFRRLPVKLACLDCFNEYCPADEEFACPNCESTHIKILSGQEFYLESIDVE
jgi:hydrogenase nickel incorporation protein HypA/HybF